MRTSHVLAATFRRPTVACSAVLAVGALIGLFGAFPSATPAYAHAALKTSTPAKGEVLPVAPARVTITFTTDIQKVSGTYAIDVSADGGDAVTEGAATLDDSNRAVLTVQLRPNLPPGRYVVRYKNVSDEDGDPFEGAFAFYVGRQPTAAEVAGDAELEAIGAEDETPGATQAASTPTRVAIGSTVTAPATASPSVPQTAPRNNHIWGGIDASTVLFIVAGAVVVTVVLVGGLFAYARTRS